jgi:hypothetical protein
MSSSASSSAPASGVGVGGGTRSFPKVKQLKAYVVQFDESGADYHRQKEGHWIVDSPISNPMSVYEQYRKSRTSWGINALGTVIVEAVAEDGTVGIGTRCAAAAPLGRIRRSRNGVIFGFFFLRLEPLLLCGRTIGH